MKKVNAEALGHYGTCIGGRINEPVSLTGSILAAGSRFSDISIIFYRKN
ncbi:MAG: hypothetical protein LBU28_06125 [Spirochaetaceae bacterium]|jgi:hypothetical protein|nr:hypothetical protein [Spirochaetaceae bacterium]